MGSSTSLRSGVHFVVIIVIAAVVLATVWWLAANADVRLRERSFVGALQRGQTMNDVRRIAFEQRLSIGGYQGRRPARS